LAEFSQLFAVEIEVRGALFWEIQDDRPLFDSG
jgi:hypothetical protein